MIDHKPAKKKRDMRWQDQRSNQDEEQLTSYTHSLRLSVSLCVMCVWIAEATICGGLFKYLPESKRDTPELQPYPCVHSVGQRADLKVSDPRETM